MILRIPRTMGPAAAMTVMAAALHMTAVQMTAVAAEEDGLEACRRVIDPTARLACYDRQAPPSLPDGTPAAVGSLPPGQPAAAPETKPATDAGHTRPTPSALNDVLIVERAVTVTGRYRFRLENGQVWEQVEPGRTSLQEGHRVDTEQTLFGAWRMRDHSGDAGSVKVRRIQ